MSPPNDEVVPVDVQLTRWSDDEDGDVRTVDALEECRECGEAYEDHPAPAGSTGVRDDDTWLHAVDCDGAIVRFLR